jgi:hypothetical protein
MEVATSFGFRTSFFISRNEVEAPQEPVQNFQLYRVFRFLSAPKLYASRGRISSWCRLTPDQFIACLW